MSTALQMQRSLAERGKGNEVGVGAETGGIGSTDIGREAVTGVIGEATEMTMSDIAKERTGAVVHIEGNKDTEVGARIEAEAGGMNGTTGLRTGAAVLTFRKGDIEAGVMNVTEGIDNIRTENEVDIREREGVGHLNTMPENGGGIRIVRDVDN
jgi:hypothetical protein